MARVGEGEVLEGDPCYHSQGHSFLSGGRRGNASSVPLSDFQLATAQQETCFRVKKSPQNIAQLGKVQLGKTCKEFMNPVIMKQ